MLKTIFSLSNTYKGRSRVINHEIAQRNPILPSIARRRPIVRTFALFSSGALFDIIDKKTILSIPNTTSRKTRVSIAIHASGLINTEKNSLIYFFFKNNNLFFQNNNFFYSFILM